MSTTPSSPRVPVSTHSRRNFARYPWSVLDKSLTTSGGLTSKDKSAPLRAMRISLRPCISMGTSPPQRGSAQNFIIKDHLKNSHLVNFERNPEPTANSEHIANQTEVFRGAHCPPKRMYKIPCLKTTQLKKIKILRVEFGNGRRSE